MSNVNKSTDVKTEGSAALKHKFFMRLAAVCVVLIISFLGLETLSASFLFMRDGQWLSVEKRLNTGIAEHVVQEFHKNLGVEGANKECSWPDYLFPHPFLGFTTHGNKPCPHPYVNSDGMIGENFPIIKDKNYFSILLTGGSVAALFGQTVRGHPRFLEEKMNECFLSPTKTPFRVFNGGFGDWKHPHSAILYLLKGDAFDGIITVEGANEYMAVTSAQHVRFEMPANRFLDANVFARQSFDYLGNLWFGYQLVNYSKNHLILRNSYTSFLIIDALLNRLRNKINNPAKVVTSLESIYKLPDTWSREDQIRFNLQQYERYIKAIHQMAHSNGNESAFFIQPVPAFYKNLTEHEKKVTFDTNAWRQKDLDYLSMVNRLMELDSEGVNIFDLTRLFENFSGSVYADPIHLISLENGESPGYELMATEISKAIAKAWALETKEICR